MKRDLFTVGSFLNCRFVVVGQIRLVVYYCLYSMWHVYTLHLYTVNECSDPYPMTGSDLRLLKSHKALSASSFNR